MRIRVRARTRPAAARHASVPGRAGRDHIGGRSSGPTIGDRRPHAAADPASEDEAAAQYRPP
jgi:hypothetical protein